MQATGRSLLFKAAVSILTFNATHVWAKPVLLDQAINIRYNVNKVLEVLIQLPKDSVVDIDPQFVVSQMDYRDTDGKIKRSSTGFISPLTIKSVPPSSANKIPQSKIDQLNQTSGGLFASATLVEKLEGIDGDFAVLPETNPTGEYLQQYQANGRPKFVYTKSITKRFGNQLNKVITPDQVSQDERLKWEKIYIELVRVASRKVPTPRSLLMIDLPTANSRSLAFEKSGQTFADGAWTIAVKSTAVRHDFANVPCAEFQSEILRQAYFRAGYNHLEDFNKQKGNQLIWSNTAAVVNFSKALHTAGWIPWDTTVYRPPTGAFLMNGSGISPGHTYIAANDNGQLIMDNGSPQGRDLRQTSAKVIEMMYQTGVFFLPPTIVPSKW